MPTPRQGKLRDLKPNARTLWWYLEATGAPQTVPEIAEVSGIPPSSVYQMIAEYPDVFEIDEQRGGKVTRLG